MILDQDVAEVEDTVHVPGRFDYGFVFENARDDAVRDGAARRKELSREKRDVAGDGEQGKDGLVRIDWGAEQCCEIGGRLRRVQVGTIRRVGVY